MLINNGNTICKVVKRKQTNLNIKNIYIHTYIYKKGAAWFAYVLPSDGKGLKSKINYLMI